MYKIKKGDTVQVIAGKDKGKRGEVLAVDARSGKVVVKGVNMAVRHMKARKNMTKGERITAEAALDASNVALVCPHTDKPTRVGFVVKNGTKVRVSKKSGKEID